MFDLGETRTGAIPIGPDKINELGLLEQFALWNVQNPFINLLKKKYSTKKLKIPRVRKTKQRNDYSVRGAGITCSKLKASAAGKRSWNSSMEKQPVRRA